MIDKLLRSRTNHKASIAVHGHLKDSSLQMRCILNLTHCILVDSSTVICWTSPFVILGVSGLFFCFYSIFDGKSCNQTT